MGFKQQTALGTVTRGLRLVGLACAMACGSNAHLTRASERFEYRLRAERGRDLAGQ